MQKGVRSLDGEQADLHEEGSVERDWIFGEVELEPRSFIVTTSAGIPLQPVWT